MALDSKRNWLNYKIVFRLRWCRDVYLPGGHYNRCPDNNYWLLCSTFCLWSTSFRSWQGILIVLKEFKFPRMGPEYLPYSVKRYGSVTRRYLNHRFEVRIQFLWVLEQYNLWISMLLRIKIKGYYRTWNIEEFARHWSNISGWLAQSSYTLPLQRISTLWLGKWSTFRFTPTKRVLF